MTALGDRYRRRADAFAAPIDGAAPDRWSSPSPCEGWLARDVVAHIVDYSGHVLREKVGISEVAVFADFDDPAAAFRASRQLVEQVLDDPEASADVANYLDLAVSFDLPQHGWDLAMATGQDATMDPPGGRVPLELAVAESEDLGMAARQRVVRGPRFRS